MRACAPLLSREYFHSVAAHPGDVMIFSQRVPHFGTQNPAGHDRQALFSMYSPSADPDQDERQVRLAHCARAVSGLRVRLLHISDLFFLLLVLFVQMFRWRYMQEAFGSVSLEFAQSLVADAAVRPLSRYKGVLLDYACAGLMAHGLFDTYCNALPLGAKDDIAALRRSSKAVMAAQSLAAEIAAAQKLFASSSGSSQ